MALWLSGFINFINKGVIIKSDKIKHNLNYNRFLIYNTIRHPATFVRREYLLDNKFNLKYTCHMIMLFSLNYGVKEIIHMSFEVLFQALEFGRIV